MLPVLETERLLLRETTLEDGTTLQAYENCPEHWQYQAVEPEEYSDGTLRIQRYLEHRGSGLDRRLFVFSAIEKDTGRLIGQAGLSRPLPKLASLGIGVAADYSRRGIATEMALRIIAFGFDELKLHRISADVAIENKACMRVMQKIGMTHEGTARDCIWAQGRWWTEAKYSILENEYYPISG